MAHGDVVLMVGVVVTLTEGRVISSYNNKQERTTERIIHFEGKYDGALPLFM
jgi:hypothetical protein